MTYLRRTVLLLFACTPAWTAEVAGSLDTARLNIAIPELSSGLPEDSSAYAEAGVFPRIRAIEAEFLPFALRRKLAASGAWGAVRVVADRSVIEDLVIHGEILASTARFLEIEVRAVDASGTTWFDEKFSASLAGNSTEPAYERLFADVTARLTALLGELPPERLQELKELALLRYGARLAPKTFGQYLDEAAGGTVSVRRLPARNDPMLDRITRIRQAEYVIIDAADERYEAMHGDVDAIYSVWRRFSQKSLGYEAQDERRIADSSPPGPRGSYEALLHAYENYKFSRQTVEERDNLAVAFDNEVRPILARLDERLESYDAWLEAKYSDWNRLLEELNELETRLIN